ncbi:pyridoxal phosphate-dependent decarboxylase family protein [Priestia aryabhattai]|uniref:pyridoxal phosphate-dependent decarboxylase family protein n=1 Tax=Priestia aryabhattai TaxID=412384 RepID=UPI001CFE253A|nr:aspartate aminotransferase family protein [Priestia aryabhattai]
MKKLVEEYSKEKLKFSPLFLNNEVGIESYREVIEYVKNQLSKFFSESRKPYSGLSYNETESKVARVSFPLEKKQPLTDVIEDVCNNLLLDSINVNNARSIGHLHCPVLVPALAGEMMISAMNQSMDSWDQSSTATHLETKIVKWLCTQLGFSQSADGTFTSGGSQSNFMGLLLARDAYCKKMFNWDVKQKGLPSIANKLRILCSQDAHFTIKKSAVQLGLGEQSVITVKTNNNQQMCLEDLRNKLEQLRSEKLHVFALVSTCGTTDFGAIDPIYPLFEIAHEYNIWLHVDAAYGGALFLSNTRKKLIEGIHMADSVTIDFHKFFFQPVSCGAFLVKDKQSFDFIHYYADYLNPEEDEPNGMVYLVNKSIQTTRRFDALKLHISLNSVGLEGFGEMIDITCNLASKTAELLNQSEQFEVINLKPQISTVIFRYKIGSTKDSNNINKYIHQQLLTQGIGILAKTKINNITYLKFTFLNPTTELEDIKYIMLSIERIAIEFKNNYEKFNNIVHYLK